MDERERGRESMSVGVWKAKKKNGIWEQERRNHTQYVSLISSIESIPVAIPWTCWEVNRKEIIIINFTWITSLFQSVSYVLDTSASEASLNSQLTALRSRLSTLDTCHLR